MDKKTKTESKPKVDLVEQARQLRLQAEELEKKVKLARGTRDLKPAKDPTHVGDDGSTSELVDAVVRLLTEHPMTFQQLLEATGARDNRIKGVLMRMQRLGMRLVNLGTEQKAIWFLPNNEVFARIARAKRATARR